jgi:hypothetical protein
MPQVYPVTISDEHALRCSLPLMGKRPSCLCPSCSQQAPKQADPWAVHPGPTPCPLTSRSGEPVPRHTSCTP